jgi:hypothetical protein
MTFPHVKHLTGMIIFELFLVLLVSLFRSSGGLRLLDWACDGGGLGDFA